MKTKLFILAGLCAITFSASAQTEKGKKMIGGNITFSSTKAESGSSTNTVENFSINPNFGYFIDNNFAIGAGVNFSTERNESFNGINTNLGKTNGVDFGIFARKYVNIIDKLKFIAELGALYGTGKQTSPTSTVDQKHFGASLTPGLVFFPTTKLGIEFSMGSIGYTHYKYENVMGGSYTANNFTFNVTSIVPNIGVNYHF